MKPRLLVVDDDPMILDLLVTRLELAGYHVAAARDGRDALNRLPDVKPHAMVLDINMPRLNGFEVLRQLQASRRILSVPTMVLTARHQTSDVQEAIQLGATDFLAKPFKDALLLQRVARLLRTGSQSARAVGLH